ncbi:hypothetical protein SH2C18_41400 [Clostridium sediminicola]|uniref:hypothetical protein n=1 Tax=Clostridium sediminicola TaxID=3114879 RepID=UPI0031F20F3D
MKGFLFEKEETLKEQQENVIFTKKLYRNINTIKLINPNMSDNILIFDEFVFKTTNNTEVNIYLDETKENHYQDDIIIKKYMYMDKVDALNIRNLEVGNKELHVLKNEQLILLPGGEIIIQTKELVGEMFISIKWLKESLMRR